MKKCASCTKDLPDAALHCVFCGAKQAPAPAAQPAVAKTVMGYGANEELNKLREAAAARAAQPAPTPPRPNTPSASPSASVSVAPLPPPPAGPRPNTPSAPPPVEGYGQGALAPTAGAQAKTMFAGPPPGQSPSVPAAGGPAFASGPASAGAFASGGGPAPAGAFASGPSSGGAFASGPNAASGPASGGAFASGPNAASGPASGGAFASGPSSGGAFASGPNAVGGSGGPAFAQPSAPAAYNPIPAAAPPYMAPGARAEQASRPIEPWKNSLRTQMFIWGAILVACFAVPISLSPLVGYWNLVIDGQGTAKLMPLILAAVGVLALVIASVPMASAARGALAAVIALAGIFVPMFLVGAMPEWQMLVSVAGTVLLIPALLVRSEYTSSPLPRILVTVGALATLAPFLIPQHGTLPIVALFTMLIEVPGAAKIGFALVVAYVLVVALSLLAWLPSPSTAGAKVFAWLLLLFPLFLQGAGIALSGGDVDFEHQLNPLLLGWAYGFTGGKTGLALGGMTLGTAYLALSSYGLASVIGKKLE